MKFGIRFILLAYSLVYPGYVTSDLASIKTPYYIHVKKGDSLLKKVKWTKSTSIYYLCKCYANKKDPLFVFSEGDQNYVRDTLPSKTYTMEQYIDLENELWNKHREGSTWNSQVYLIEDLENKGYNYYRVKFHPDPHEE